MAVTVVEGWPLYSGGIDCESFLIGKKKTNYEKHGCQISVAMVMSMLTYTLRRL